MIPLQRHTQRLVVESLHLFEVLLTEDVFSVLFLLYQYFLFFLVLNVEGVEVYGSGKIDIKDTEPYPRKDPKNRC